MIKTVIQKIILTNFGKFIKGIQKDKLSVDLFGGNFKLQNISLNHEYFDSLNTPFKLAYSSIGKLNLTAHLSKLSSVPVECVLDNIYVIFEFRPQVSNQDKEQMFDNQKKTIHKYVDEMFKNYLQKIKEQKKQDGIMAKLGKKIIDNLQMKIVNVHIRFQEHRGVKYGWGLTLNQINFVTADNKWQPTFVDRQKEGAVNQKLFKKMNVKNLSLYWQNAKNETEAQDILIKQYKNDNQKKIRLCEMIQQNKNTIISITSQFKLTLNPLQDEKCAIYEVEISLQPIKFQLDRIQVMQMIDFTQKNIMQNQLLLKNLKQKKKQPLNECISLKLKQQFTDYIEFIIYSQHNNIKKQEIQIFEIQKKEMLENVFKFMEIQEQMKIALIVIKKFMKKIRQEEVKKKKRGWFGSADTQLDQKQSQQLEKFVQFTFNQHIQNQRSQNALFFTINAHIAGGNFKFIDRKYNLNQNQTIQFQIGIIDTTISKSGNQSFLQIDFSVQGITLGLILPQFSGGQYSQNRLQILRNERNAYKDSQQMQNKKKLISLVYKKSTVSANENMQENNTKIITDISIQMQRIIFVYKKLYFKKFKQFFTFKNFNDYMMSSTMEKIQNFKEKQKNTLQNSLDDLSDNKIQHVFFVKVNAISPKIVCPFNENQCWCFSLGDLNIISQNNEERNVYPLKITAAYLRYYNDISLCLDQSQQQDSVSSFKSIQSHDQRGTFSVINDMNFSIIYQKDLKQKSTLTKIQLPQFQLNFSAQQYSNLMSIKNIFSLQLDEKQTILDQLKKARLQIQQQKIYQNTLSIKNQNIQKWTTCHGVLSGDYIYLYQNKKELKETHKVYIKNSTLTLMNKDSHSPLTNLNIQIQKQMQLELISQHQYCYLACQTLQELQIWEQQIAKKARQFKTISQLMEFYDQNDDKSSSPSKNGRKRSSAAQISIGNLIKRNIIQIQISKIGFKYQDYPKGIYQQHKMITLMNFQVNQIIVNIIQSQSSLNTNITIENMLIIDEIFHYNDVNLQTFLSMKKFDLKIVKPKKLKPSLIDSENKLKTNNINLTIEQKLTVQDLKINWKPDVILIILDLMKKHLSKQQKYRMDDETNKNRQEHFQEIYSNAKYMFGVHQYIDKANGKYVKTKRKVLSRVNKFIKELLKMHVQIQKSQVIFIHRESHLVMFKLESNNISTKFVMGQNEKFIQGSLGSILLYDMTMYPKNSYSIQDKIQPYCIAKKKPNTHINEQNERPVVTFYFSSYEPSVLPNQQRVDSFIYIEVEPIQMIYVQQVVFRLIDYCLIQIMLLINQPQMLTANENLLQQLKKKQSQDIKQKPIKILFSKYELIIKKLINPFFMDIYCEVRQPQIILKGQKKDNHFYRINFEQIMIQNQSIKTQKRFSSCKFVKANDFVYEQNYRIKGKRLEFHIIDEIQDKANQQMFFDPIQMDLVFNKLVLQDQLNLVYPQLGSHPQFQYDRSFFIKSSMSDIIIPKCSRFEYLSINKLVNFNFTYDDECDQMFIHNFKITKMLLPKPIIYTLQVDKITFNANYCTLLDPQIKLFRANINDFTFEYLRKKDLNSQMNIKFGQTKFAAFEYIKDQTKQINLPQKIHIQEYDLLSLIKGDKRYSSDIIINNKTTGQKVIQMTVQKMNVVLKTGLLQLILQYTLLEDWIFPIINKNVPELTFFANIENMTAQMQDQPQLLLNKIMNQQKKLSQQKSKKCENIHLLQLCGILCYKFHRRKTYSGKYFKQQLQSGEMLPSYLQKLPQQTSMNLALNTQLNHCYKNTNEKRKVMQKFTLNMSEKRFLKIANLQTFTFKNAVTRSFNLDKCFFKVSVMDLLLMKDIIQIMGIERQYITLFNERIGKANQIVQNSSLDDDELSSLDSINLEVTSLSFYLINSWKQTFIPIINFKVQSINLMITSTFKKNIMKGDFSMILYYFNSLIFRWQPAIEKVNLSFFKQDNRGQGETNIGGIQAQSPLMLNISKEMFLSVKQTMAAWTNQSLIFNNRLSASSNSVKDSIEFISHYIIRNETGFDIQIYCDRKLKYKLKNFQKVDHQLQMQDFEDENQKDVIIAFRIIHPEYQFKMIGNVSVNAEKQYIIKPILSDGQTLDLLSRISIRPTRQNSKQVLIIGSIKKVIQYFDNQCVTTVLPFDSPAEIKIPWQNYGQKSANLYATKESKNYKFIGKDGVLTIKPRFLVFNYTPIPLTINDKIVRPNEYAGIFEKPIINGQKYKQCMLRVENNQKQGHFYVYCEAYLVDYYGLYFDFGPNDKLIKQLYTAKGQKNGYPYYIYIFPQAQYKFRVKISEKSKQHYTLKSAIGQIQFQLRKSQSLCNFSAFCYLNSYKNQHLKQFNRVIQITPMYVISNATKDTLKICQKDSLTSMSLRPHERCPFFWESFERPKQIKIALIRDDELWGYSGPMNINKSCQTFVLRNNQNLNQYRVLSISVQRTNTITFIHIFEGASKYKVSNKIKGTLMTVYQSCLFSIQAQNQFMNPQQYVFNVRYNQQKDFGYELPIQSHNLTVELQLDTNMPRFNGLFAKAIMITDIQSNLYVKKIPLFDQNTKKQVDQLILVLEFQGNAKKLKLVDEEKIIDQELTYQYYVKLPSFGVSLIGIHDDFRRQIIFCLLEGINIELYGNEQFKGYQVLVGGIRIQNQLKHNVFFPTILQSYKTKNANFFLQFVLNRDAKNSQFIRSIGLSINRTIITVTSQQLQALQQNLTQILSIKINSQKQKQKQMIRQYELFNKDALNVQQSYYFQEAEIQPLKLIITFKHVNNWGGRLLKTFSSINQCNISVDGKKITHFNAQNIGVFMKSVQQSYKEEVFKNILPLIGNLSILGSPVSLVQKIGSGFKDLIQLPAEEFDNGPLQIGKGIAKGTKSLVKNTFQGAMNTVQSFTGSIGNGLTALVDDQEFQKKRQKIKNQRTQHVGQGLKNGAKSIFNGFSKGITGLITQPVKGAEKDGLAGFFVGGFKGLTGLVIKPVSGIIDATTKTAQGIKNTANFLSPGQRQKRLKRVHNPRPFYSNLRQFRSYDNYLSKLGQFLQKYGEIKVALGWVGYFQLKASETKRPILLVTYQYLYFLDLKKKEIVRQYYSEDLIEAIKDDNHKFRLTIKDRKYNGKEGNINLESQGPNFRIIAEINKLVKFYRPKFTFE